MEPILVLIISFGLILVIGAALVNGSSVTAQPDNGATPAVESNFTAVGGRHG